MIHSSVRSTYLLPAYVVRTGCPTLLACGGDDDDHAIHIFFFLVHLVAFFYLRQPHASLTAQVCSEFGDAARKVSWASILSNSKASSLSMVPSFYLTHQNCKENKEFFATSTSDVPLYYEI